MDAQYCTWVLNWPCLNQAEWATWIQVFGSLTALFLAIYVPVRMRRIEELDRRIAILSSIVRVREVSERYVQVLPQLEQPIGQVPVDFKTAIGACEMYLQNPSTPTEMVPLLGHVAHAGSQILQQWSSVDLLRHGETLHSSLAAAVRHLDRIVRHLESAQAITKAWKRNHWFALLIN
ncbi:MULTISPECIES: hypothetical protein [Stenotrophomonas]|uniref:hypothetical protein n=1 Tax=Stenotrophomonas TaxID=40323 RepID=UPI0012E3B800|nr:MULTISPECIES: hypothetical protein [Stenotrophomonas]